jgi:hypothetical protein
MVDVVVLAAPHIITLPQASDWPPSVADDGPWLSKPHPSRLYDSLRLRKIQSPYISPIRAIGPPYHAASQGKVCPGRGLHVARVLIYIFKPLGQTVNSISNKP